jgi:hypothetical protein
MNHLIPKPIVTSSIPSTRIPQTAENVRHDMNWLKQHHEQYLGQWVALHNGELLSANPSFCELRRTLKNAGQLNIALFINLKLEQWK